MRDDNITKTLVGISNKKRYQQVLESKLLGLYWGGEKEVPTGSKT
jgi:hypothetical protein